MAVHDHCPLLRCRFFLYRTAVHLHPYWKLYFCSHGMAGPRIPHHCQLPRHVCATYIYILLSKANRSSELYSSRVATTSTRTARPQTSVLRRLRSFGPPLLVCSSLVSCIVWEAQSGEKTVDTVVASSAVAASSPRDEEIQSAIRRLPHNFAVPDIATYRLPNRVRKRTMRMLRHNLSRKSRHQRRKST